MGHKFGVIQTILMFFDFLGGNFIFKKLLCFYFINAKSISWPILHLLFEIATILVNNQNVNFNRYLSIHNAILSKYKFFCSDIRNILMPSYKKINKFKTLVNFLLKLRHLNF